MKEYELLLGVTAELLSIEVTKYLVEGWSLYGTPFSNEMYYCQAVTR